MARKSRNVLKLKGIHERNPSFSEVINSNIPMFEAETDGSISSAIKFQLRVTCKKPIYRYLNKHKKTNVLQKTFTDDDLLNFRVKNPFHTTRFQGGIKIVGDSDFFFVPPG